MILSGIGTCFFILKRKRSKRSQLLYKTEDSEGYQFGPIRLERKGRLVSMSSFASEQIQRKIKKRVLKTRPKVRKRIDKKIAKLRQLISKVNTAYLVGELTLINLVFFGIEESSDEYNGPPIVDYVLSIALTSINDKTTPLPTTDDIDRIQELARDILMSSSYYFGSELADDTLTKVERDLRFFTMQRQLLVRGDAYANHELDTVVDILQPLDETLYEKYGFRSSDIRSLVELCKQSFQDKLHADAEVMTQTKKAHKLFKDYCDSTEMGKGMSEEDFRAGSEQLPEVKQLLSAVRNHSFLSGLDLCEVVPTTTEQSKIVHLLSCKFGDNEAFLLGDWNCWPLNDSIINKCLFVEYEGKYYCLARHALSYHLRDAIESLIAESDQKLFNRRYEPARNKYLESTALTYLANALPGSSYYGNLYYTVNEDGTEKRCELDGLLQYDNTVILIEAKAGTLSAPARRGSISRLRKDVSKLIETPFDQCLRAHSYIKENNPSVFYDVKGNEVYRVNHSRITNIYLVTVTLDSLGSISGDLNTVRRIGLATGNEWFWSVGIHDLRIIAELSEFPSQLLHYLQRRIGINTHSTIKSIDEVDLFGVYLAEGLYFEDSELQEMSMVSFNGYTDNIDEYYYRIEAGQQAPKPRQDIPESFRDLILRVEATGKIGFTEVTLALLDMDGVSRYEFSRQLDERVADVQSRKGFRDFTMLFEQLPRGISVMVVPKITSECIKTAREYCKRKQSERNISTWLCILIGVKDRSPGVDFFFQE